MNNLLQPCEKSLCLYCKACLDDLETAPPFILDKGNRFKELSERDVSSLQGWSTNLDDNRGDWEKVYSFWPTFQAFKASAFAGCRFCAQMYLKLPGREGDHAGELESFCCQLWCGSDYQFHLEFQRLNLKRRNSNKWRNPTNAIYMTLWTSMPEKDITSIVDDGAKPKLPYENVALGSSMDNSASWEIVKSWITERKTQHSSCKEERANLRPERQFPYV
ncbi:hypothetical protein BP5796_12226 [Coleophoma crateriformis]|uniref:Uncharacterized protein n=1 Tax=Coleophoma crateriformis TaxID=565419 RepID=A0A3D8Q901_9HELO|nr:hypothetical protein BP5796_12226 [Coleophoma crateriformis]